MYLVPTLCIDYRSFQYILSECIDILVCEKIVLCIHEKPESSQHFQTADIENEMSK